MSVDAPPSVSVPAGWYADPEGAGMRYWNGAAWTERTAPIPPPPAPPPPAEAGGPVATRGDWIGGVVISLIMPLLGAIAGIYYVSRGGDRARCGWMCIGLSIAAAIVLYTVDPYNYFHPGPR